MSYSIALGPQTRRRSRSKSPRLRSPRVSSSRRISAPAGNTKRSYRRSRHDLQWSASRAMPWCRLLARDHAAPESTLALSKADQPCCGRVPPLAWCSRSRSSAASLAGALMYDLVCIGASWGGLKAVGQLLTDLPEDFDLPIAIAQ